jgi:hypothetical protein
MGGALGAAPFLAIESRGWVSKPGDSRTVTLTRSGKSGLKRWFGVDLT